MSNTDDFSRRYRNTMGLFATGVTVMLRSVGGEVRGMTANAVTSDSDTSVERRRPRRRERKRDKKSSRRGQSARRRQADNDDDDSDDEQRKKNLKCKHCKKFGRTKKHLGLSPSKCHWNTKYKGYRPRNVCDQLGINFKPRIKFSPELGGFPKSTSDTDDSE